MYVTYNGAKSSMKMLPGGGPQGAYLGGIIFIIKYNGAFLRPPITRHIQGPVTKWKAVKVKFVDDGTVAVSVDLKWCLVPDQVKRDRPINFHELTGHILPETNNLLQYMWETRSINKQKLNESALPNPGNGISHQKWHLMIEYLSEIKLLGVVVSQDLR